MSAESLFLVRPFELLLPGDVFLRTVNGAPVAVVVDKAERDDEPQRLRVSGRVVGTGESLLTRFRAERAVVCVRGDR